MGFQKEIYAISFGFLGSCGFSMIFLWDFFEMSMIFLLGFKKVSMKFLVDFFGNSMGFS